ncbi:MAG: hypothetical protein KGM99_06205 [Burkholderiales bacterium]|nr:hypothetical protein [Burkholderiales bacterium]
MLSIIFRRLIALLCLTLAISAQAQDSGSAFSVHGFGTLGVVHNTSRQVDIVRDLSQNDGVGYTRQTDFGMDSNLGVQINTRISDTLDAAIQVVSRKSANDFQPEITWAYGRYAMDDDTQLRVGRLGFDVYLLADSRNIGYSYQWVRPPIDFFGGLIISYFDGADLVLSRKTAMGILRTKLFTGVAREKTFTGPGDTFFSFNQSSLYGAYADLQQQAWQFRLGYSELKLKNEFPPLIAALDALHSPELNQVVPAADSIGTSLSMKNKKVKYISAGIAYESGPLQAQLMLSRITSESQAFPSYQAGYLTGSYRLGRYTPYATYSAASPYHVAPLPTLPVGLSSDVDMLAIGLKDALQTQFNHQHTISLGVRYDLNDKSNLKLQIDRIHSRGYFLTRNQQPGWNGNATLISLALNFIF